MVRFTAVVLLFASAILPAAPDPQQAAVLAVVQRLFDGMAARDAAVLRAVMLPEGRYFSVRADKIGGGTNSEFTERIAASKETLLERMWNPRVMIHGSIASVWAPYDFHRNGKFSHCGVDSFQLLKTTEGWKVATITYTVETTGCQPSPLGPPR